MAASRYILDPTGLYWSVKIIIFKSWTTIAIFDIFFFGSNVLSKNNKYSIRHGCTWSYWTVLRRETDVSRRVGREGISRKRCRSEGASKYQAPHRCLENSKAEVKSCEAFKVATWLRYSIQLGSIEKGPKGIRKILRRWRRNIRRHGEGREGDVTVAGATTSFTSLVINLVVLRRIHTWEAEKRLHPLIFEDHHGAFIFAREEISLESGNDSSSVSMWKRILLTSEYAN